MTTITVIGALLMLAGVVYMATAAIRRGRMSDPASDRNDTAGVTLEPRQRGTGFLGLKANWPGIALLVLGVLMLALPLLL